MSGSEKYALEEMQRLEKRVSCMCLNFASTFLLHGTAAIEWSQMKYMSKKALPQERRYLVMNMKLVTWRGVQ